MSSSFQTSQKVDVLPLIDLVFLVLVFFVLATLNMTVRKGLDVDLPRARAAKLKKDSPAPEVITIVSDEAIYVNKERMEADELRREIKRLKDAQPGVSFSIKGDRRVRYESLMRVVDALQDAGVNSFLMETQ